jgi:hypothetical protein
MGFRDCLGHCFGESGLRCVLLATSQGAECQPLTGVTLQLYNMILSMNITVPGIPQSAAPPEFFKLS